MQVTPYLYFKGECESALRFYEACGFASAPPTALIRSR